MGPCVYAEEWTKKFSWWRTDGRYFSPRHQAALREHALERIRALTPEGYTSGKLVMSIGNLEFEGWWEVT